MWNGIWADVLRCSLSYLSHDLPTETRRITGDSLKLVTAAMFHVNRNTRRRASTRQRIDNDMAPDILMMSLSSGPGPGWCAVQRWWGSRLVL